MDNKFYLQNSKSYASQESVQISQILLDDLFQKKGKEIKEYLLSVDPIGLNILELSTDKIINDDISMIMNYLYSIYAEVDNMTTEMRRSYTTGSKSFCGIIGKSSVDYSRKKKAIELLEKNYDISTAFQLMKKCNINLNEEKVAQKIKR